MKKKIKAFLTVWLCLFLIAAGGEKKFVLAETATDENYAYQITAVGENGLDGVTSVYYRNAKIKAISFDLLKSSDRGEFGLIVAGSADDIENFTAASNYVVFSSDGEWRGSDGVSVSRKTKLQSGANYVFAMDKNAVYVRKMGFFDSDYIDVCNVTFPSERSGVWGLIAFSEGIYSSTTIIDDLKMTDETGNTVFYNEFNFSNIGDKGTLKVYSTFGGFAEKFDKQTFNVAFTDESGNILSTQRVCEYNYATPPAAPEKKGFTFDKWSGDLTCVDSDCVFYPVYADGTKKGCGSALGGELIGFFAVACFLLRRRTK